MINRPMEPLRVDAGAGTGKTATLAGRIVHLVERGEVEPEQVLGITFTNKAAGELADRIRTALGDAVGPGREVEVHTYHGFAARLLEQYGALVGVESDARIVTPTFARQLMEDALAGGSYRLLDLTNRAYTVNKLARLAGQLGDNLLTPAMAIKAVPVETDDIWDERRELLETLERYWSEKTRMRVVDYADLIERAAKLVEEHPEIAKRVADRYRVVLLDEYQDTNPAQREMLRGLFAGGYSVTAVGDPDQTIYEWRGASLENFAGFPGHFPLRGGGEAATLPLTLNRRSGSAILDLANDVRDKIDDRGSEAAPAGAGDPARRDNRELVAQRHRRGGDDRNHHEVAPRRWDGVAGHGGALPKEQGHRDRPRRPRGAWDPSRGGQPGRTARHPRGGRCPRLATHSR